MQATHATEQPVGTRTVAQGFAPPFDRHDWTVDRCGKEVRNHKQLLRNPLFNRGPTPDSMS